MRAGRRVVLSFGFAFAIILAAPVPLPFFANSADAGDPLVGQAGVRDVGNSAADAANAVTVNDTTAGDATSNVIINVGDVDAPVVFNVAGSFPDSSADVLAPSVVGAQSGNTGGNGNTASNVLCDATMTIDSIKCSGVMTRRFEPRCVPSIQEWISRSRTTTSSTSCLPAGALRSTQGAIGCSDPSVPRAGGSSSSMSFASSAIAASISPETARYLIPVPSARPDTRRELLPPSCRKSPTPPVSSVLPPTCARHGRRPTSKSPGSARSPRATRLAEPSPLTSDRRGKTRRAQVLGPRWREADPLRCRLAHGNTAAGRAEDGRGAPGSRPVEGRQDTGRTWRQHRKSGRKVGRADRTRPLPDARVATAPATGQFEGTRPRPRLAGSTVRHGHPAIRTAASYRLAALAGPSGAIRNARHRRPRIRHRPK